MTNTADPQSWNRYSYVNNNPLRYTDPTGHMRVDDEGGGGKKGCSDPRYCENGKPKSYSHPKSAKNPAKNYQPKKTDFVTISAGLSVPSTLILTGGLLCLSAAGCAVGGPLAEAGLGLVTTPANAFSLGPALTLDSYGNLYFGLQGAVGKTIPGVPIGGEIVAYKIDSSSNYVTENENRDFIMGWNVAANSVGFPGMSGFQLPPSGKSLNPISGQTATSGTFVGTTLAEATISYTFELPLNIGHPPNPWNSP